MENRYPTNIEIIRESFRIIKKDSSIIKYAVIEVVIIAIFSVVEIFSLSLLAKDGNLLNLIGEMRFQGGIHAFAFFILSLLYLVIVFYIFSFFIVAVMYNAYQKLQKKDNSFWKGISKAKVKSWEVFKASLIAPFQKIYLIIYYWKDKETAIIKGRKINLILFPDISFMIPFMLFENLARKEAILKSFRLSTRHFYKITFAQLREGSYYILWGSLGFIAVFISMFIFSLPLIFIVIILVLIYWAFLGILRSLSYNIFLVVLYYHIKRAERKI